LGTVEFIHIASVAGEPMRAVEQVHAVPGAGLESDRYATRKGQYSDHPETAHDLTLIEAEIVESLTEEEGISLDLGQTRRNVTTRGIRLNDLVGRRFRSAMCCATACGCASRAITSPASSASQCFVHWYTGPACVR